MRRLFILFSLVLCITTIAQAQTYTQHLQDKKQGQGSVTVTQSHEIEELVNGANVSARTPAQAPAHTAQSNAAKPGGTIKKQNTTTEQTQHSSAAPQHTSATPQHNTSDAAHKTAKDKDSTAQHREQATASHDNRPAAPVHDNRQGGNATHETPRQADNADTEPTVDMRKKVMRRSYKVNGYRVQVFAGGNSRDDKIKAQNAGNAVKKAFPSQPIYVHFYSPRWICRMGNYRTYQEASAILTQVRKMGYKQACIVSGKINVAY